MEIELPDPVSVADAGDVDLASLQETQAFGDAWLTRGAAPAVIVPSIVIPLGRNILVNPLHPDIKTVPTPQLHPFDWNDRLFRRA